MSEQESLGKIAYRTWAKAVVRTGIDRPDPWEAAGKAVAAHVRAESEAAWKATVDNVIREGECEREEAAEIIRAESAARIAELDAELAAMKEARDVAALVQSNEVEPSKRIDFWAKEIDRVRSHDAARIAALEAEKASLWFAYLELRLDCARRDESLEKDDIEAELNAARAALKGSSK